MGLGEGSGPEHPFFPADMGMRSLTPLFNDDCVLPQGGNHSSFMKLLGVSCSSSLKFARSGWWRCMGRFLAWRLP